MKSVHTIEENILGPRPPRDFRSLRAEEKDETPCERSERKISELLLVYFMRHLGPRKHWMLRGLGAICLLTPLGDPSYHSSSASSLFLTCSY